MYLNRFSSWLLVLFSVWAVEAGSASSGSTHAAAEALKVASLMYEPVKWDKAENAARLTMVIRKAAREGAQLVVTPEGALDGYVVNEVIRATGPARAELTTRFNELAERCDGPFVERFRGLCRELKLFLVLGFLEADCGRTYNTAVLIDPNGSIVGKYRKTHFAQGYSVGDKRGDNPPGYCRGEAYPVFDVGEVKIGIMICYDRRVPLVAGNLVRNGARFIVNPSYGMMGDCNREFISSRASENKVPILFVHPRQTVLSDAAGRIVSDVRPQKTDARMIVIPIAGAAAKAVCGQAN